MRLALIFLFFPFLVFLFFLVYVAFERNFLISAGTKSIREERGKADCRVSALRGSRFSKYALVGVGKMLLLSVLLFLLLLQLLLFQFLYMSFFVLTNKRNA